MNVSYSIIPSGDMAGILAYRTNADEDFDPSAAIAHIVNHQSRQPRVIVIRDIGVSPNLIETFCSGIRERGSATLVLATRSETPTRAWYMVDRVILITDVMDYRGTPVHEAHLLWSPGADYPVVAPLGAQNTHIYAYAATDELDQLVSWVRQAPYQVGIIRRPL